MSILVGCGGQPTKAGTNGRDQTRVYAERCLFRPVDTDTEAGLPGVVDAVVGGVISGTLGRIGKALRSVGEKDADVVVGRYPAEFSPGDPSHCIFVAKGGWSADSKNAWNLVAHDGNSRELVKFGNYFLRDPDFFLEIAVVRSAGGNALRLVPNYFEYRRLIDDGANIDGRHLRGIAIEVAVHPPGEGPKSSKAVGAAIVLGSMSTGYGYDLRSGTRRPLAGGDWEPGYLPLEYTSAWFPTFAPAAQPATNSSQSASTSTPSDSRSPSASAGDDTTAEIEARRLTLPRTITVTFTETRAAREFLLFLADVFDASKDEVQAATELAVLSSKQAEAELAGAKATNTLMSDYFGKLAAAEVKILEYCSASTADDVESLSARIKASSAANVAQRSANVAAMAASQPMPYTSFVPVGDGMPADSGFCN
ncbi:hypothetical protein [Lentisalinibacter salinarum]|uniref:hypothetical protein n=1 Tax=Lentisalinibacter salinarum TaxID=2992239 RepID=UPI003869BC44